MSTIHLEQTTTSTPEQLVAGLTDFGPGRSKLFGKRVLGKALGKTVKATEVRNESSATHVAATASRHEG